MENKIYLFDGTNFANWSFRMEIFLREKQLEECIKVAVEDMVEFLPEATDSESEKKDKKAKLALQKQKEARCMSLLVEKIADSQLEYIKGKSNPKMVWTTLENLFARKGTSGQFYLLR